MSDAEVDKGDASLAKTKHRKKNLNILQDKKIRKPTLGDLKIDDTQILSQQDVEGSESNQDKFNIRNFTKA